MAVTAVWVNVNEKLVVPALQEAREKLVTADGEVVLDFSSVRRLDASALHALEDFARIAVEKAIKVTLRGVNVDIYKVLKLVKLTQRFSFVS